MIRFEEPNWACQLCTFENNGQVLACEMCGTQKPEFAPPVEPAAPAPQHAPVEPAPEPVVLRSSPEFLQAIEQHCGARDLSESMLAGMENIVRKSLNLQNFHLDQNWLLRVSAPGLLANSFVQANRSVSLLHQLLRLSLQEDERLKSLNCPKCLRSGSEVRIRSIDGCRHIQCASCLHLYIMDLVNTNRCSNMLCPIPRCQNELPVPIIQSLLTDAEFEQYSNACLMAFIEADQMLVVCPNDQCRSAMEVVKPVNLQPPAHITEVDSNNRPLSVEAWLHYNEFRVRCRGCSTNFCSGCRANPYHMGFTCQSFTEYNRAKHCRFCQQQLGPDNTAPNPPTPALEDVCTEEECVARREASCGARLECGHACLGVADEKEHIPCIVGECAEANGQHSTSEDLCNICFVEELGQAPLIKLTSCGHIFHSHCVIEKVTKRWPGVRITFGFLKCPLCKVDMQHPVLEPHLEQVLQLYEHIKEKALVRLQVEGMDNDPKLTNPDSRYFGHRLQFALDSFAYYNCFKCKKAYFGGRRDCEQNADAENRPPNEFICFDCADLQMINCSKPEHAEYAVWKCRFCCSIAVWFCWGTTHFCEPCHSNQPWERAKWSRDKFKQCRGRESCPLRTDHPPNGSEKECEFSLGCGMCVDERRKKEEDEKKEEEIIAKNRAST